jgi:hypothetical protein
VKRITLALLSILTTLSLAASSLSVTAVADPAATLPGIPIRLIVTVENTSDMAQNLPGLLVIEARADAGAPFVPDVFDFPVRSLSDEYRDARTLQAREKRVYEIPLSSNLTDGTMADPRLWTPGTYRLRVLMHDDLRNNDLHQFGLDGLLGAGRIRSPLIASSQATVHIEEPAGVDREIWTILLAKTEGRGLSRAREDRADAIAKELWSLPGTSAYKPYLVIYMRHTPIEEKKAIWKQITEQYPAHPVAEVIRVGSAQAKAHEAKAEIRRGGDLDAILRRTEEARAELMVLEKEARHDLVRIRARNALATVKSRERITEMYRDLAPKQ